MCECDCEPPEFYRCTEHTARKRHRCCECGLWVVPGQRYVSHAGKWDFTGFEEYKRCKPCEDLAIELAGLQHSCVCFTTLLEDYTNFFVLGWGHSVIYLDTETCGLHGLPVLIQYAEDDGPITLYEVWRRPVAETLQLIEWVAAGTVCGFNLAFDWFHLCKLYTIWQLLPGDWVPAEHIEAIAEAEPLGRDGPCLKPAGCLDLLLVSRKGPYQALMAREDVRIRKVPTALAYELADELEKRVELDGIYFARRKDHTAPQWQVFDRIDRRTGEMCDQFKDVVLKFHPAGGLKYLAEHALGFAPKAHFGDIEPVRKPVELGYAPLLKRSAVQPRAGPFTMLANSRGMLGRPSLPSTSNIGPPTQQRGNMPPTISRTPAHCINTLQPIRTIPIASWLVW